MKIIHEIDIEISRIQHLERLERLNAIATFREPTKTKEYEREVA